MSLKRKIALLVFPIFSFFQFKKPNILSVSATVNELLKGKSLARFGDGELQAISGNIENSFQNNSFELSEKISKSINTHNKNVMIAIAPPFSLDMKYFNKATKNYWEPLLIKNWHKWKDVFTPKYSYYNAFVTRPYFDFYENVSYVKIGNVFREFKLLFANKRILIVEGRFSRFGVNDDLLDNALKIFRILCPAENAFDKRDSIKNCVRNFLKVNTVDIVLLSLGQTATVLVCELSDLNVQLVDIGHLDIEYNWFLQHAKEKISITGKWVNEADIRFKEFNNKLILNEYYSQVIAEVK